MKNSVKALLVGIVVSLLMSGVGLAALFLGSLVGGFSYVVFESKRGWLRIQKPKHLR
jgi:hypothetical protein